MDSHGCSIDKNHVRTLRTEEIRETNWYEEVRELAGSYCLKLNADRVLTQSRAETTVSLIRVINNPTDYRPVGILMINKACLLYMFWTIRERSSHHRQRCPSLR